MISTIGSAGAIAAYGPRPAPPPDPEQKFQELDADASGTLDVAELETMAAEISEISGREVTVDDLLAKLDGDGSGGLEMGELPAPGDGGHRGPPPFVNGDGPPPAAPEPSFLDIEAIYGSAEEFAATELDLMG